MSDNVHGHQLPKKGINVNPDNPVFQRHEPESVPAEIPQGLHGAPALRSELESAADPGPVHETKVYADGSSATGVAPLPDLSPEEQAQAEQAKSAAARAPEPAQDAAIEAADENAHNAAVAAEVAEKAADDATANAEAVRSE